MDVIHNYKDQDVSEIYPSLGLSEEIQIKLCGKNITTIRTVLTASNMELLSYGLTYDEINKIKISAANQVPNVLFVSALNCETKLASKWKHITFGCSALDKITRNGLPIRGITEIVGEAGCGKSQICLQLSLNVQLPLQKGGLGKSAIYICTEDAFPSKRLVQIADAHTKRFQHDRWLDNIFIEHTPDAEILLDCVLNRLPRLLSQRQVGLIVIDSVGAVFRLEHDAISRARNMQKMILALQTLANKYECAVICVNQVTASMNNQQHREMCVPCLGLAWSNLVTTQLKFRLLNKQLNNLSHVSNTPIRVRSLEVSFSPELPNEFAEFNNSNYKSYRFIDSFPYTTNSSLKSLKSLNSFLYSCQS